MSRITNCYIELRDGETAYDLVERIDGYAIVPRQTWERLRARVAELDLVEHNSDIWCERASKAEARLAEASKSYRESATALQRQLTEKQVRLAEAEALLREAQPLLWSLKSDAPTRIDLRDRIDAFLSLEDSNAPAP